MQRTLIKRTGNYLTLDQKKAMIREVTDVVLPVEGEDLRPLMGAIIEDVQLGAWA